ncbi:hypothetical protein CEXT_585131 [Caerostris extrusa]|uniref:Uncharacterized protein n=1 Tax=Caerostris extrusa TaxID=172846 RepID=A0AAV4QI55_CAEEX|nr:hypothetical protein CEXT_585131 [Caerostris extrusa]
MTAPPVALNDADTIWRLFPTVKLNYFWWSKVAPGEQQIRLQLLSCKCVPLFGMTSESEVVCLGMQKKQLDEYNAGNYR